MGKGNVTTTPGITEIPGARRHRQTLRQRLLLSSATEAPQRGSGTRRQRRAAKAKGGIDFARLALRSVIGVALSTLFAGAAYANPLEGTVTAGAATIQSSTPKSMEILQSTDKAIINWKSFSIDAGEKVTFQQPSASSVTLNRVTGADPSKIMGSLSANGTVMLVNPNGVVIGAGAKVDVGGLVATTANISDANFMAGKYQFDQASAKPNAMVVNEGDITVKDSGLAALVAPHVRNSGVIRAKLGKVALGGAETFTLDFHGDGLISFDASSAVKTVAKDADGKPVAALVVNSGEIAAEGGSVTLSARAVKGVIDNVINTNGVIKATSVGSANGKIVLSGGDNGKVTIGGTVDASGRGAGQTGGTVVATGAEIVVKKNTRVDASGSKGGGEVAIGSQTGRSGTWSDKVTVEAGATLSADAVTSGKGGSVTVLSQKSTKHAGKISARGGAEGGDGGFAEVSSHKDITLTGSVDLTAPKGAAGTFLLDPESLRIVSSAGGSQDGAAADGTIGVNDPNLGSGDAVNTVSKQVLESIAGNANIVLEASGLITVETSLDLQTTTGHSFTLRSLTSSGIAFTDASYEIRTNGGDIVLEANGMASSLTNIGKLTTRGGAVRLTATSNVQLANLIDTTPASGSAGTVSVKAESGSLTSLAAGRIVGGPVTLTAGGDIGASGAAVSTSSAQLSLVTGGNLFVANDRTLTDLSVTSTHRTVGADSQLSVASTGLTFAVTDSSGGTALDTISQVGGLNSLAFTSDRNIQVGTVSAGTGAVALTSTAGNITGTGASLLTGGALTLTAKGSSGSNGAIGSAVQALNTAGASLTATAGSGGLHLSNARALALTSVTTGGGTFVTASGDLTVGAVSVGSNMLNLTSSGGSILNDADTSTTISSYSLVLNAAGSVGTSGTALTASSYNIDATSGAGGVFLTTSGSAVLGSIVSTNGDVAITTGGTATIGTITSANGTSNIAVTANGAVSDITATTVNAGANGNVTLTTANGSISALSGTITGDNVTLTAGGNTSTVMVNTAAKRLTVTNNAGNVTVMQTGAVTVDDITSTGTSVSLTVTGGAATLGTIKASNSGGIAVTATGGAILGKDASNQLSAGIISLSTDGAIGSVATHLRTSTGSLTLTNVGDLYLDNSGVILTGLSITNRHVGGAANALELTSEYFNFVVGDNGTATILEAVGSPKLSTLSFNSDIDLIVGDLATVGVGGKVTLTSTTGSIRDDGSLNTRINADTVTLSAASGSLGDVSAPLALNATKLTLTTGGDLHITNLSDMAELSITSTHADTTVVNGYTITAPNFVFDLTDDATNGYLLRTLVDTTGQIFTFKGDRDIRLGRVDLTSKNGVLPDNGTPSPSEIYSIFNAETTNGSILDDGSKTTVVLAGSVNLVASKAIGSATGTEYLDVVTPVLNARASDGGIYVTLPTSTGVSNQSNLITLGSRFFSAANNPIVVTATWGDIAFGSSFSSSASSDITVTATHGSILNPNSGGLRASDTGTVTLTAGKDIGSADKAVNAQAGTVVANAGGSIWLGLGTGATSLDSLTAGGDITVTKSNGVMTVGSVNANSGAGTVTLTNTSGSIQDDSNSATLIAAGKVILSANGGVGSTSALNLATANLSIATGGSIGVTNTTALTDLTLTRGSYSGGTIGITTVNGQVFTLSDSGSLSTIQTVTSSTALNFAFNSSRAITVGTVDVGTGGSVAIVSSGDITNTGNGGKITAGKVSLEAGTTSSVGRSGSGAISLDTGDLSLTAGRNLYVDNNGRAFSKLAIASTNTTTGTDTASLFSITGTGAQAYALTDEGTTHKIDITGAANSSFSFSGKKNITVDEIAAAGGSVSLTTAGGGANSTISMWRSGSSILASSVTLSANGTGTNGGSIGASDRAMKLAAASLTVVSNGDIYINNSNTALTALDVTVTHKSSTGTGTYQFNALGSNRSFTVTEANGIHTLALTTPSSGGNAYMDLRYSVDRGIVAGTIDAGTSSTGSVALISTGTATSASGGPSINGSGTITAGSVSLTATGSNGNIGGTNQVQTSTQKLSIASGGNVTVSNNTTLTDLTLDFRHNKSGGGANTYSISSTGLTATFSDSSLQEGLTVTNITQSGLKLTVSNDKALRVAKIDVGSTGTVDLTANSGTSSISATNGSGTTVTAGSLTLKATSVEHTSSGSYFTTQIGTLSANLTGSLKLSNSGTLTLKDVKAGSSADIKVTNSGSLLQSGTKPLRADKVTLTVEGGSIGASGTPLLTETRTLEVTAGRNVYLTNSADLHALSLDVRHASTGTQNVYDIRSEALTFALTDTNTGSQYTLGNVVDASGLDFSFKSDNSVALGTINGGLSRKVAIETTGTGKDILSNGSSMVTAGTVALTATGGIGQAGSSANHIATMADTLALITATDAFVDNGRDLTALSLTSSRTTGAGTYQITAPQLVFTMTDDGTTTTLSELTDTTGLAFTLDTQHALSIGTLNVQNWGTVDLTSATAITGAASATAGNPANRITAGTATLSSGGGIGSSTNKIHLSASSATFNVKGDLYVESDTRIGTLKIKSALSTINDRTYSLTSVNRAGAAVALSGVESSTQAVLVSLNDADGVRFSFDSHRKLAIGGLDVGKTGTLTLNAAPGIVGIGHSTLKINAGIASLTASSGAVGKTGGEFIAVTAGNLTVKANDGAVINLHGSTYVDEMVMGGALTLNNTTGDIALGSISMNGANAYINNQGGSILSGTISGSNIVNLTATGSIGNVSAVSTQANSTSTTLTASAAGSIAVSESRGLIAQSVVSTGGGAIKLSTGSSGAGLLTAGTISTTGAVSLTSSDGSIDASNGNLVSGGSVELSAIKGGIAATGSTLNVATTDLTIKTAGTFAVADTLDLAKLTIDRTPYTGTATSGTMSLTATNLSWNVTGSGGVTTFTTLTDSTGLDFTFKAPGAIAIGTVDTGASSTVSLTATGNSSTAGSITAVNNSSTITAGSLTLDAQKKTNEQTNSSSIGTSATALGMNVSSLTASSGTGGLFVKNAAGLNLSSITTGGALTVIAATGDLTVSNLSYDSSKALTLTATAGRILNGGSSLSLGSGSATLTAGVGIGTADAAFKVSTSSTGALTTNVTGAGGVYLDIAGSLTGGLTAAVNNGPVVVTGSGNITLTNVAIATDAAGNSIAVTSTGGSITAGTVTAGANNGSVTLSATGNGGKILAANGGSAVTGKTVVLNATAGIGTSSARVGVGGAQVQANGGSGDIYLSTTGATALAYAATTGGKIDVQAGDRLQVVSASTGGGAITISSSAVDADIVAGSINAGSGAVTLSTTGGWVYDDGLAETRIVGGSVSLTGSKGVGTSSRSVQTTTGSLTLASATGSVYVTDDTAAGVTVTSATASSGSVTIASAGTMTVQSVSANTTSGAVALTAAGSILGSGNGTHVTGHSASLTATDGSIGVVTDAATGAGTPIKMNVASLTGLTATGSTPVISVDNINSAALTLGNNLVTLGTGGSAYIRTAGNLDASAGLSMTSGNLLLQSGGVLTLPTAAINLGTGALTLKGTTDVVAAGGSPRSLSITAGSLTFASGSSGGNTTLNTTVGTIDASLTGSGKNLTVNNTGTLTAATLGANGTVTATSSTGMTATSVSGVGTVSLTATTGDLTVGTINAGPTGTITLSAAGGSLLTGNGTSLTGGALNLTSNTGIGTSSAAFTSSIANISATVTGTGGIYLAGTSFTLGNLSTNDGDIAVTASGAISDGNATTGITAGGSGSISLVSTGGAVSLTKAVTSTGPDDTRASVTVQGTSIALGNVTSTGAQTYTGNTTLGGALSGKSVTVTGNLTLSGANRTVTATGGDLSVTGTLTGGGYGATLNAAQGGVTLGGAASNLASLSVTAGTIGLRAVTTTGAQTYTGATSLQGAYATGNGAFTVTGATTLAGGTTVNAGSGNVLFSGTVNGANSLVITSSGATQFTGTVGGTTALTTLTIDAGGTSSLKSVTTTGAQTYSGMVTLDGTYTTGAVFSAIGAVTLAGNTTVDGTSSVVFMSTVDGAYALAVNNKGMAQFNGTVGGTTALASLTTDAAGTSSVKSVTTTGAQTYNDAVTLDGTYNTGSGAFTANAATTLAGATTVNGGSVLFAGTVDGAQALVINSKAATQFTGAVGGTTALASLTTDAAGTSSLRNVTTTGAQTYNDAVTLNGTYTGGGTFTANGAATLAGDTTVNGGSAVLFAGTVDGAYALAVNNKSTTTFSGAVGGTTALASLTTDAAGTSSVKSVTTTGAQTYNDAVTLDGTYTGSTVTANAAATLVGATTVNAGTATFNGTVNGAQALTVAGTGTAQFNAAVGGTTALASLTTAAGGTASFLNVTTSGAQTHNAATTLNGTYTTTTGAFTANGAATLAGDTTVNGGSAVLFAGAVDGAYALAVNNKSTTTFTGAVGGTTALASLTTDAGGTSSLRNVTTTGAQTYNDAVTLNGTYTTTTGAFSANGAATLAGATTVNGGSVLFAGTVDGAQALVINSKGATQFTGTVGGTTALASLTTDAGGTSSLRNVTTTGAQTYNDAVTLNGTYTSGGTFTANGAATLAGDTTVNGGSVLFAGTVDGAQALVINSKGATQFTGTVGGTTALASLTTDAGGTSSLRNVVTTGAQTYNDAVTLNGLYSAGNAFTVNGAATLAGTTTVYGGAGVLFAGTVDGAYALAVNNKGATAFTGAVGGTTALASLTTDSGSTNLKSVTTTGAQTYNNAVTLDGTYTGGTFTTNAAVTLGGATTVNAGTATFNGTVNGAQALTIAGTGTTTFNAAVGGTTALASLTTNAGATASFLSVTTTGAQTHGAATTLNGAYSSLNSPITFNGETTLAGTTLVDAGYGTITFNGTVNGAQDLTAISTGAMVFNAAVGGTTALASLTTGTGYTSLVNVTTTGAQSYGGETSLMGTYATGNGAFTVEGPVTLAGAATVNAGSGAVTFNGTVNGAQALVVNGSGATQFNAAVGGTTALASLTTDADGTTSLRSVTTSGAQTYNDATTLNGAYNSTDSAITFNGATTLAGTTVVDAGYGTITFNGTVNGTVDGAQALTATSTGAMVFNAAVGGTTALASLTTGTGYTSLVNVTTAGDQSYGGETSLMGSYATGNGAFAVAGPVTLAGTTTINAGSGAVTFNGTVNGAQALTVNSGGATRFNAAVGDTTALASLTTDADGTTSLRSVTTSGAQTYNNAVTLDGAYQAGTVFTAAKAVTLGGDSRITGTEGILLLSTLDGGQALTLTSGSGDILLGGAVGGGSRLGALAINGGGITTIADTIKAASLATDATGITVLNGGSVDTTGAQSYADAVMLGADTVLTGTQVALSGGIDAAEAGRQGLTIAGNAALSGTLGTRQALAALTVGGETLLTGATAVTSGAQTYGGAVRLAGSPSVLAGTGVTFAGALDGGQALTVTSGTGDAVFAGTVGGTERLGDLTVNSAGQTRFAQSVRAASVVTDAAGTLALNGGSVDTTGTQTYGERAVLGTDTRLTGRTIVLAGGLDAATRGGQGLTIAGDAVLNGAVGGTQALSRLSVTGAAALNGGAVTTMAEQNFGGAVTLGADTVLTGGTVSLLNGVSAANAGVQGLTVDGDAVLAGVFGETGALRQIAVSGGTRLDGASVTTTGAQRFGGALTVAGASALTSTGGDLVFGGAVDSANRSALSLNGASIRAAGDIGASGLMGDVTVRTSGGVFYDGAVTVRSLTQTAGGESRFAKALTATGTDGLRLTGAGFTFGAAVNSAGSLALVTTDGAGTVTFGRDATVVTEGGFTQSGGSGIVLPASITAKTGPITLGAVASLPDGHASIAAGGPITMAGLQGKATMLTMASDGGALLIGQETGTALQKIDVLSLTVPKAGSARMFGTVAGKTDALAASAIDSPLRAAPYFINNTPWGPTQQVSRVAATVVVVVPVPSTPGVASLFTGTVTRAGLTPNALAAYAAPQVLTLVGAGTQPEVLSTGSGMGASAGAGTTPGTNRAGAQPEVLTTGPAASAGGNQQTEKEEAR
ncbi:filamentous hemagglutinin N-terminal domain-containing protein [Azospirillum brasilense]|uniref:filamentous hemagglutinin N-terminal domain-containing protein n=1 Tax=Azospirillum brasilense TaxID=192 RepID=UPI000E0AA370|nr:filamentous hemagglutinin N-terminal domain-containing protein [Azospirillum brasilense]